jgi:energy-coupling factor transporter ATP-binding protein EcfA2
MNSIDLSLNPNETVNPFSTLMEMRVAHSELLQHSQDAEDNDTTNQLLPKIELFLDRGQKTGVLLDREDDRLTARGLLDYWRAILYRLGHKPSAVSLANFDISLAPELDDSLCPYRGLEAFQEKDCELFHGRQRLVDQLLQELQEKRLLAVVGSSGSGKSSVVLGGLVPSLKAGKLLDSQNWQYYGLIVPGSNPLENLARLFCPECDDKSGSIEQKAQKFIQNSSYLTELLNHTDNQPSALVIDQFEEIFQLCLDVEKRQAFISNLLEVIQFPEVSHRIILTMRSDLEYRVTKFSTFDSLFKKGRVQVVSLGANELREVIEKPAESVGLKFEEGLVDKLIQDFLGEDEVLPLLQFTLLKLWEKRERNRISMKAYTNLGRGRLALPNIAEDLYVNHFNSQDQVTCKRIFLKMVQPTEGKDFTSRRILCRDLYQVEVDREDVENVLNKLINKAHLVKFTKGDMSKDAQVEVAHEALIRNWPRLVGWLEDERVNLRNRLQLTAKAKEWDTKGRIEGALLRGKLLEEAEQIEDLNDLEKEFIRVSKKKERQKQLLVGILVGCAGLGVIATLSWIVWKGNEEIRIKQATKKAVEQETIILQEKIRTQKTELRIQKTELENQKIKLETTKKEVKNQEIKFKKKKTEFDEQLKIQDEQLQINKQTLKGQGIKTDKILKNIIYDINQVIDQIRSKQLNNPEEIRTSLIKIRQKFEEIYTLAQEYELEGFKALNNKELRQAQIFFEKAYKDSPTYHSVDEILHQLLTDKIIQEYEEPQTSDSKKQEIINNIYQQIVDKYSWGATCVQLNEMKKSLGIEMKNCEEKN